MYKYYTIYKCGRNSRYEIRLFDNVETSSQNLITVAGRTLFAQFSVTKQQYTHPTRRLAASRPTQVLKEISNFTSSRPQKNLISTRDTLIQRQQYVATLQYSKIFSLS